ncbi:MAG: hypothetical protein JWM11_3306, partial [Planctomycetaceae bacterium]|nr:hypothetical protein [Planctomycetaceae bacterium]
QSAHNEGWDRAIHSYYGRSGIAGLDQEWSQWVLAGCPAKVTPDDTLLASGEQPELQKPSQLTARSQAPDREPVSVVDAAHAQDQFANSDVSMPRRGSGLQAPPPPRRGESGFSEPAMLSQVDLGSETEFVPPQLSIAASKKRSGSPSTRQQAIPVNRSRNVEQYASNEAPDENVEEERLESQVRVSLREQPARPVATPIRRNTLATPSLRLDSRTQLGKSRPISIDDL